MLRLATALVLSGVPLCASASPNPVLECGEPNGWSYYALGSLAGTSGWRQNGMRGGSVTLLNDGGRLTVRTKDASGSQWSLEPENSRVVVNDKLSGFTTILIAGADPKGRTADTFLFRYGSDGSGEVTWSFVSVGSAAAETSVFKAECRPPA